MLKTHVPKFLPDLSARLRDIAEKPAPAKLKPIVGAPRMKIQKVGKHESLTARSTRQQNISWQH